MENFSFKRTGIQGTGSPQTNGASEFGVSQSTAAPVQNTASTVVASQVPVSSQASPSITPTTPVTQIGAQPTATPNLTVSAGSPPPSAPQGRKFSLPKFPGWAKWLGVVVLIMALLVGGLGVLLAKRRQANRQAAPTSITGQYNTLNLPLDDLVQQGALLVAGNRTITVNGQLKANNGLVLAPTPQPSSATKGQIYFDQASNQLAYFNGQQFVALGGGISNLGGTTGSIGLGGGLTLVDNTLSNAGVLSINGQSGAVTLTAGTGITIEGSTISSSGVSSLGGQSGAIGVGNGLTAENGQLRNSGVVSLTPGTANLVVSNDGSGNLTISSVGGGTGTVTSSGGTAGRIAKFTSGQNIEDSLLSEAAGTVTTNGNLSVTGSLGLGSALTVINGGTGASSLTANGVLVGNGTGPVSSVAAGGAGLCLMSTAGAPAWQACPGGGGVTSLNGATGALSIANATEAGGVVTLNDASTAQKGIAQFNATNFTAASGTINTAQDINITAAPTFGRITLTSSQASDPMLLVNNTNVAATGNLLDLQQNGVSRLAVAPSGALTLSGAINGQTISSTANFTGTLAVSGVASLNGGAAVTGTLNANTITPTSALTVGATGQSFTLQGNASSTITATNLGSTTGLAFQTPTANVTYRFLTAAVGTYDVCTTAGNCVGLGGGITGSGTSGTIAKFTASGVIGNSLLSETGSTVTVNGNLNLVTGNQFQINGSQISSANLSNDANLAKLNATQTFTGNQNIFKPGADSTTAFQIQPAASATPVFNADTTNSRVGIGTAAPGYKLDVAGDVNLSSGSAYKINGVDICTSGGCTAAAGSGSYIQNTTTVQTNASIAIQSAADGDVSFLVKSRAAQSGDLIRVVDSSNALVYNLDSFGGGHYVGKLTVDSQVGIGNSASSGEQLRISPATTGTIGLSIYANSGQTADLFNILNSTGGVIARFGGDGQLTLGRIAASGATQAGTLTLADGTLSNFGATLNTTTLTANRTITLPDATGTVCLQNATACGFAAASGSANYIQNQSASDQTADFRISGTGRAGTSLQAPLIDTATAAALNIGTTNATGINLNKSTTVTGNFVQSGGNFSLTSSSSGSFTTTGALNMTIAGGSTWSNSSGDLTIRTTAASSNLVLENTASSGQINIGGLTNNVRTINVGRGTGGTQAQNVNIGSQGGSSATVIDSGTAGTAITSNGNITVRTATNSTTGFRVQSALGLSDVLNVDTSNGRVGVMKNNPGYALDVAGDVNIGVLNGYKINGTNVCTSSGCTPAAGSSNYIQNTSGPVGQSANIYITSATGSAAVARFQSPFGGTGDLIQLANGVGTVMFNVTSGGTLTHKPTNDGTIFQVQTSGGTNQLSVDTTNRRVIVGPSAGDTNGTLLVAGNKTNAGDPTGVAGAMYYNSSLNRFRCYEDSMWKNCVGFDSENNRKYPFFSEDFMSTKNSSGSGFGPWVQGSTGGGGPGTLAAGTGEVNHPGIVRFASGTVTNSGWRIMTELLSTPTGIRLAGGEVFEAVLKPITTTNTTTRVGFIDTTVTGDGTDGLMIEIVGTSLNGKIVNNSTATSTGSSYTITASTWYRVKAVINDAADGAAFYVYNDSGTQLWTDTITATVPTAAGRETGHGIISTNSGTSAVDLIDLDYLAMWWPKKLTR